MPCPMPWCNRAVERLGVSWRGAQAWRCSSQASHVRRDPETQSASLLRGWRCGDRISGDTSTLLLMRPDSRKL